MTEAASEDDIDLEILQAQVDASLAQTAALVDSWRSPAFKHTTSGVMTETQFEASLRRPARLGVGALAPEATTGTSHRETARLRGRLVGGAKRTREANGFASASHPLLDAEDEEESRGTVVKKKARHDPFAPSRKNKKAKKGSAETFEAPQSEAAVNELCSSTTSKASLRQVSTEGAPGPPHVNDSTSTLSAATVTHITNGKKKKKKRSQADVPVIEDGSSELVSGANTRWSSDNPEPVLPFCSDYTDTRPSTAHGNDSGKVQLGGHVAKMSSAVRETSCGPPPTAPSTGEPRDDGLRIVNHANSDVDEMDVDIPLATSPMDSTHRNQVGSQPTSILNLDGPPSQTNGTTSFKKKRRRHKKRT